MDTNFTTWKTIKLGTHPTIEAITTTLEADGFKIGTYARQILAKTRLALKETEIELVRVSVTDLGFTRAASRKVIYERALSLGLVLCPAEVGPQLRRQYADQPYGDWFLVAMEPIADSARGLDVFGVRGGGGGQWLDVFSGHPDREWDPERQWVFARNKPSELVTLDGKYSDYSGACSCDDRNHLYLVDDAKTLDNLAPGDVLEHIQACDRIVQGVIGEVVVVVEDKSKMVVLHSISELKESGWAVKQSTPVKVTITKAKVAKLLGIEIDQLEIKD